MGNKISIDDSIFELKLKKKELERQYQRRDRDSKNERKKAKDALITGETNLSRIHAENSLRMHQECEEIILMSSRLDKLCSKLERASTIEKISSELLEIVPKLRKQLSDEGAMGYKNIDKIKEINQLLNCIEDNKPEQLNECMEKKNELHADDAVNKLLDELLDEHKVEIDHVISLRDEKNEFIQELSKNQNKN